MSNLRDSLVYPLIVAIVGAVAGGTITYFVQDKHEDSMVRAMSSHFESVDENMELEYALEQIYRENEKLKKGSDSSSIDDQSYDFENVATDYDKVDNEIDELQVDLIDENIIYDGNDYLIYEPSCDEKLNIGSDSYNKGFELENGSYILLDLKGKYSKVNFDVGHINGASMQNSTLKIYLDGKYQDECTLYAEESLTNITIDLNYAKNLKLELADGWSAFGFVNCTLEK